MVPIQNIQYFVNIETPFSVNHSPPLSLAAIDGAYLPTL